MLGGPVRIGAVVALLISSLLGCHATDQSGSESAASSGTATEPSQPAGSVETFLLQDGDRERRYDVYVPPGADGLGPLPVVVALHWRPGTVDEMREMAGLDVVADEGGFLVVYVEGLDGRWDASLSANGTDRDVSFVLTMLEAVAAARPVDRDRVYVTGISAGAAMALKLAVRRPETFAAIAAVSGGFDLDASTDLAAMVPDPAPSLITFIGGLDVDADAFADGIELWRSGADCSPPMRTEVDADLAVSVDAASCADGSEVEYYSIPEMGHSWPGGAASGLGQPDAGVNASQVIWEFFAAHPRR